jgi:type IV secretion system protein VirD4
LAAALPSHCGWAARRADGGPENKPPVKIEATRQTGLPSTDTALGRKAKEVADAQEAKLLAPPPVHGTARWANAQDAAALIDGNQLRSMTGSDALRLGTLVLEDGSDTGLPLVARHPGHLLTVAGTGQGKSATQIVENLMTYTGSVVVLDPKGELYDLTAERRRRFSNVFRLAPLARGREPRSDHYNPLNELDDPRERGNRARRLAEMLVVRQGEKGASDATFFENEAINLLTFLIMVVMKVSEKPENRNLRTLQEVRRLCNLPLLGQTRVEGVQYLQDVFAQISLTNSPFLTQQAGAFTGLDSKLLGSFRSEINSNLAFFDGHPGFAEVTSRSDFRFADLAREPTTVYLAIPLKDMYTSFRFLRAMVGLAFAALEEQRDATKASVLFVLDEFAALRDMPFMRDAVAQMRSSGAWFWFFVQDVAQLHATYGRHANVFLSQSDHQVFFGATLDAETKSHISTNLGVSTFAYRDPSLQWSHSVGTNENLSAHPTQIVGSSDGRNVGQSVNINHNVALAPRPLLTPFEVGTFLSERRPGETHPTTAIIFSKQAHGFPITARRQHWRELPQPELLRADTLIVALPPKTGTQ